MSFLAWLIFNLLNLSSLNYTQKSRDSMLIVLITMFNFVFIALFYQLRQIVSRANSLRKGLWNECSPELAELYEQRNCHLPCNGNEVTLSNTNGIKIGLQKKVLVIYLTIILALPLSLWCEKILFFLRMHQIELIGDIINCRFDSTDLRN